MVQIIFDENQLKTANVSLHMENIWYQFYHLLFLA